MEQPLLTSSALLVDSAQFNCIFLNVNIFMAPRNLVRVLTRWRRIATTKYYILHTLRLLASQIYFLCMEWDIYCSHRNGATCEALNLARTNFFFAVNTIVVPRNLVTVLRSIRWRRIETRMLHSTYRLSTFIRSHSPKDQPCY